MLEVDARGLSCPEPLIMTMDAMKGNPGQALKVSVSSSVARDNVIAYAQKNKREANVTRIGDDYLIEIAAEA